MTKQYELVPVRALVEAWAALAREGIGTLEEPARLAVHVDADAWFNERIRMEVDFVDYVRDRDQADVCISATPEEPRGSRAQYHIHFVGAGRFSHIEASARLQLERHRTTRPRGQDPDDPRRRRTGSRDHAGTTSPAAVSEPSFAFSAVRPSASGSF